MQDSCDETVLFPFHFKKKKIEKEIEKDRERDTRNVMLKYIFGTLVSGLTFSDIVEYRMKNQDAVVELPIDTVSIIVCALNESKFIEQCVQSLRYQSIIQQYPEYFELILVDNGSVDNTIELAKPYVDMILRAPRGKLNARNMGALHSNGNIIVAVDGDCNFPYNWLNSLLKPFQDPNIVAVVGSRFDKNTPFPENITILANFIDKKIINTTKISGGNSAYYKHHFYMSGGFNTNINQLDQKIIQKEEEYDFGARISKFGKIVFKLNAPCFHLGGEIGGCRLGLIDKEKCEKFGIGIQRFG